MADNAAQSIKDLDEYIKKADKSLQTLVQRYERLFKAMASGDELKINKNLELIEKGSVTLVRKLNTLENKLKELYKTAGNTAEFRRLSLAIKELTSAGGRFPSILGKISEGSAGKFGEKEMRELLKGISSSDSALRRFRNAQKEVNKGFSDMIPTLQRLGSAFGVAFSIRGLAQFGKKLIEVRGEFERQQVALRSILQNKQLADDIWEKTMQAALQSPFTAMQLTTYTKQLAAYRIETDKLFETTKRLADVSAGLGVDMQRLILAYGQVKAANYLRASEIRQFTEAGVNVLGELRDYFNEVKGMSVDTARVMEMVTKRLVTFGDVEAIFKRMTDQGGIFYEMQYVQSQTVRGQIAKLHDAYDQMLNSIGKANEGVLKNMVSLLNNIVKNWQEFKTVIDLIAWPLLISSIYKFSRGLMTTGTASRLASAEMNKVVIAGAKTKEMFTKLFATISVHPFIALGAAVAAVGVALLNHAKHVRDINKRYEDLMLRTYETQKNFDGLSDTLKKNLDTMKEATKGSEEYNEASRENENIVKKLKDQYPELLQDIDIQKDGYEKLIEKIKEYNDELENQIRLEYAARAGFWQDDLTTNIADLQETQREREMQFLRNREKAEKKYLELKAQGKEAEEDEFDARMRNAETWQEQSRILMDLYNKKFNIRDYERPIGFSALWGRDVGSRMLDLEKNIENEALIFNDIIRNQLKNINEDLGDDIQQFIKDNESQINELFKDKEGAGWKLLNKQITKFFTAKGATDKETREVIQNFLNKYLLIPIQLDWDNTNGANGNQQPIIPPDDKNKKNASKLISLIKEMRSEYDKLSKSAYGYAKSEEKVRESYAQSVENILGKAGVTKDYDFTTKEGMIAALNKVLVYANRLGKDAAAEVQKYIDQLETEITINAQVRIRENFARQMEEAFNDYELTLELEKLNIPKEAIKDIFPDFDTETLGELQDRMDAFYESQRDKDGNVLFDEDDLKEYRKWADKIDAEILKSRKEKAKEYSKYLEREYSERAKLEMQHAKDVAFVTSNISDEKRRDNIVANLNRKFQQDLNELNWKSFKESSFYVDMMDDLASLPKEYMQTMLNKIDEILRHPETLSPRALKEAINARQKILEAQMNLEPLDVMKSSKKTIRKSMDDVDGKTWKQTKEKINDQIKTTQEEIDKLEEEARKWDEVAAKMKVYEDAADNVESAKNKLSTATKNLVEEQGAEATITQYQNEQNTNQQLIENLQKRQLEGEKLEPTEKDQLAALQTRNGFLGEQIAFLNEIIARERELQNIREEQHGSDAWARREEGYASTDIEGWSQGLKDKSNKPKKRIQKLKQYLQAFKNFDDSFAKFNAAINSTLNAVQGMGNAFYDMFDALGGETDALTDGWKEFGNTMITQITQTLTMIPMMVAAFEAAGMGINSAMGIIGLIAEALQLLFVAIGAIAKLHDAGYEKEIENQQKIIDNLTRAYDRLEKSIEKTHDTASYMSDYNEMTQNLYEQIEALNKQIAAEEAKKNSDADKIQEYKDGIQDAEDELEELKQKQIEVFGGIGEDNYRSAAEGFVDAWKSAFLETGDGLQGLQDHFDEFLQDWFVKQATMRIAGDMLENVFKEIDKSVEQNGEGGTSVTMSELARIKEMFNTVAPELSEALENLFGTFGVGGEGSLSGLAAGIQGMTEEQANILEAYWNSVRGYTANIDMNVAAILGILSAGGGTTTREGGISGGVDYNPQLQQLQLIAQNTKSIDTLLQSVTRSGHAMGGNGFKVFVN